MSGDRNERDCRNNSAGDCSGALNEDLYQWDGDQRGSSSRGQRPTTGNQDLYQYDGAGAGGPQPRMNRSDCDWRPDPNSHSPLAEAWRRESDKQRGTPLNVDENGDYTVKFGDCLSTIAERELRRGGQQVSHDALQDEMNRIIEANVKQHPSLGCNPDLVKTGWKLHIPDGQRQDDQPPPERPPVERPPEQPPVRRQPDCDDQCVPRPVTPDFYFPPRRPRPDFQTGPVIINNYIDADNVYLNQSSGSMSWGRDCVPRNRGGASYYDQPADRGWDYRYSTVPNYQDYAQRYSDRDYAPQYSDYGRRQQYGPRYSQSRMSYRPASYDDQGYSDNPDAYYSDAGYQVAPPGYGPERANPNDFTSIAYSAEDLRQYQNVPPLRNLPDDTEEYANPSSAAANPNFAA